MINNPQLIVLSKDEFKHMKKTLAGQGINVVNEEIAVTVLLENKSWIAVNGDTWSDLDDDEQHIVLAHESAHTTGIIDEEEADIWALDVLNPKQKTMLINMWGVRHGHDFKNNS